MINEFEKYLFDDNLNDQSFNYIYGPIIVHKERLNNRFIALYQKDKTSDLMQESYKVGGYLDIKDKVVYDADYQINELMSKDSILSTNNLKNLENELLNNIREYIEKYSFNNSEILKSGSIEKYSQKDERRIHSFQKDVRELFIRNEKPKIELDRFYREGKLTSSAPFYNKEILIEYLNDKEGTVKKYSKVIIEDNKEELGLALNLFDDKNKYLKRIQLNKNNEFKDLYINKKIYDAIKDETAKTLNITIKYNSKELTFKCDYSILKNSIIRDERGTCFYGVSYEKVSQFISENKHDKNSWGNDFDFSHISSITYGKRELYKNDNIKDKSTKERGDR